MAGFVARVVLIGVIGIGVVWWCVNLWHEPAYGDTVEYWRLADTLRVDEWRALAYALMLRVLTGGSDSVASRLPIYAIQTAATLWACYYFMATLDAAAGYRPQWSRRLLLTLSLATMPVVSHFALSILTDSLSAAFFLLALCAITRIFLLKELTPSTFTIAATGILASGMNRPERFYLLGLVLMGYLAWEIFRRDRQRIAVAAALMLAVMLGVLAVRQTQTDDLGRPRLTMTYVLFDRTVQGRAEHLWLDMPETIRQRVTLEDARAYDSDPNGLLWLGRRLEDAEGRSAMRETVVIAVEKEGPAIGAQVIGDAVEYVTAPVNYARESILDRPDPTQWTNTRMRSGTNALTLVYLGYSFLVTGILVVAVIPRLGEVLSDERLRKVIGSFALVVVLLAVAYAMHAAIDFHIRYALPIYMIEIGVLVWMAIPGQALDSGADRSAAAGVARLS